MRSASALSENPELHSPLGLVAGNGIYPIEFCTEAKRKGLEVVVAAHIGEANKEIEKMAVRCLWIKVGELGKIIGFLKKNGVKEVAFAGGISRVKIFSRVKFDLRAISLIARKRSVQDDILLRGVAEEFEKEGMQVISASALLKDSVVGHGYLTARKLNQEEKEDAVIGWKAAKGIGALEIGQTVVVSRGMVVAVEAIEGTDAAILRAGDLSSPGCVVVKLSKPQQDLRIDLPTIGIKTIQSMISAKARVLVVESKKCVLLEPDSVIKAANSAGISILAVESSEEILCLS